MRQTEDLSKTCAKEDHSYPLAFENHKNVFLQKLLECIPRRKCLHTAIKPSTFKDKYANTRMILKYFIFQSSMRGPFFTKNFSFEVGVAYSYIYMHW